MLVLASLLSLALVLRLAFVGGLRPGAALDTVDAQGYHTLALNLLEYGAFVPHADSAGVLGAIRMPLYPVFIALLVAVSDDVAWAIPVAQAVVDTVTVLLVYRLGSRVANRNRGYLAALLYAINPITILFVGEALTEVVLAFLIALTLYAFVDSLEAERPRRSSILTGILCGLCILCKPNVILLPLLLAVGIIVHHRRITWQAFTRAGLLVCAALLALIPWLVRNRIVFGQWFLSLAFQDNLAHVSAVATVLHAQGEEAAIWSPRWEQVYMEHIVVPAKDHFGWEEPADTIAAHEAARRRREMGVIAGKLIREHPTDFAVSHLKGVARSLVPSAHRNWYAYLVGAPWPQNDGLWTVIGRVRSRAEYGDWPLRLAPLAIWWTQHPVPARCLWAVSFFAHGTAYALIGIGLWSLRTKPGILAGLGLVLGYLLVLPGPIAHVRFWVPAVPVAAVLIGCAFSLPIRPISRLPRRGSHAIE
jgi:4-amino-4-deoxy-L-arabinose transferase-like glycosyltransferase